jgi:glycosyltransferase involved in cell wall biosynthesis
VKVLCLTDWPVPAGARWLWDYPPESADSVDFVSIQPPADSFAKWGKVLAYYPALLRLAWRALKQTQREEYDVVLAFEGKDGLPYGFLRHIYGQSQPKLVIMFFSVKGVIMHFLSLARYGMAGVDHIIVPTRAEIPYYTRLLDYPQERITYCPLGTYNPYGATPPAEADPPGYIFAGGRSERDYGTLLRAVDGLDAAVVVAARRFNLRGLRIPPNVQVHDLMPMPEFARALAGARFVVAPIQDVPHAAGLTQIIYAMAAGKAVIAARTPGTVDYVDEGVTGLLYEPGDPDDLRRTIRRLLDDPEEALRMGAAARALYLAIHTFPAMARRIRTVLAGVAGEETSAAVRE